MRSLFRLFVWGMRTLRRRLTTTEVVVGSDTLGFWMVWFSKEPASIRVPANWSGKNAFSQLRCWKYTKLATPSHPSTLGDDPTSPTLCLHLSQQADYEKLGFCAYEESTSTAYNQQGRFTRNSTRTKSVVLFRLLSHYRISLPTISVKVDEHALLHGKEKIGSPLLPVSQ